MNILEGLFFGTQVPFDEVDMDCPEYYSACHKADECKSKILERHPDLEPLMEDLANAQMEQAELGRFHEFSVGFRVGAQMKIEMMKEI